MNPVSIDIVRFLETKGIGRVGTDIFANVLPDSAKFPDITAILDEDTNIMFQRAIRRRLTGNIQAQDEFFCLQTRGSTQAESYRRADLAFLALDNLTNYTTKEGTHYQLVLAVSPVIFIESDRNDRAMHEARFKVVRSRTTTP